ncbi:MAG: NUDIX domain-containing protein [Paracoccus sp. (in: a-proteobacteria)]|uniref:NUDIX domain-containing protein n=1 Tax=Paracoccus sp. TaxID=267 RepID=UPI002E8DA4E4|nr:DNA mismatch repair protein MutT [Pseudomonadota bacterium]
MTSDAVLPVRDAATIMALRRDGKGTSVLMGMRGAKAMFMPSKFVFPGGAVDHEDAAVRLVRPLPPLCRQRLTAEPAAGHAPDPNALAAAALRELAEETGLLIGQPDGPPCPWPGYRDAGLTPDASALTYVFRAITPPGRPRRFDARFFIADAADIYGDLDDFSMACDELSHLQWVPLSEARNLDLPFITEVVLAELARLLAGVPPEQPLPQPQTVPFFDNRGPVPRFFQIP